MEYQTMLDLSRQSLSHHVRGFEVLRNVIHTTIMFGVGAASAVTAYGITKASEGVLWSAIGCLACGSYIAVVTGLIIWKEYRVFSTPSEGFEPNNLRLEKTKTMSSDEYYNWLLDGIQKKIGDYKDINGRRGNNLTRLVKSLLFAPIILLPFGLLGLLLAMCR